MRYHTWKNGLIIETGPSALADMILVWLWVFWFGTNRVNITVLSVSFLSGLRNSKLRSKETADFILQTPLLQDDVINFVISRELFHDFAWLEVSTGAAYALKHPNLIQKLYNKHDMHHES